MILRKHSVLKAAGWVFGFWFVLLLVLDLPGIIRTLTMSLLAVFGVFVGGFYAYAQNFYERRDNEKRLIPADVRGLKSTLGKPPMHRHELPKAKNTSIAKYAPPELEGRKVLQDWLKEAKTHSPHYARLFQDILDTLAAHDTYPAAHPIHKPGHDHGGRSLIQHSLLVAHNMMIMAADFQYKAPAYSYKGRDKEYKFNPNDPLIPVLGIAHDIGKIECLVQKDGEFVDMLPNHDEIGVHTMARMEAFWDDAIPTEERQIFSFICAHYHKPYSMPVGSDGMVLSDRMHALLELLIAADIFTGRQENGYNKETFRANNEKEQIRLEDIQRIRRQAEHEAVTGHALQAEPQGDYYTAMIKLFSNPEVVSLSNRDNMGFLAYLHGFEEEYGLCAIIREDRFAEWMAKELKVKVEDFEVTAIEEYNLTVDESKRKDPRARSKNHFYAFNRKLLELLSNFKVTRFEYDEQGDFKRTEDGEIIQHEEHYHTLPNIEEHTNKSEKIVRQPGYRLHRFHCISTRYTDENGNLNQRYYDAVEAKAENSGARTDGFVILGSAFLLALKNCPPEFRGLHEVAKTFEKDDKKICMAVYHKTRSGGAGKDTLEQAEIRAKTMNSVEKIREANAAIAQEIADKNPDMNEIEVAVAASEATGGFEMLDMLNAVAEMQDKNKVGKKKKPANPPPAKPKPEPVSEPVVTPEPVAVPDEFVPPADEPELPEIEPPEIGVPDIEIPDAVDAAEADYEDEDYRGGGFAEPDDVAEPSQQEPVPEPEPEPSQEPIAEPEFDPQSVKCDASPTTVSMFANSAMQNMKRMKAGNSITIENRGYAVECSVIEDEKLGEVLLLTADMRWAAKAFTLTTWKDEAGTRQYSANRDWIKEAGIRRILAFEESQTIKIYVNKP